MTKQWYRTEVDGDYITVTRRSDGKTITFERKECIPAGLNLATIPERRMRRIAIELAKDRENSKWGLDGPER